MMVATLSLQRCAAARGRHRNPQRRVASWHPSGITVITADLQAPFSCAAERAGCGPCPRLSEVLPLARRRKPCPSISPLCPYKARSKFARPGGRGDYPRIGRGLARRNTCRPLEFERHQPEHGCASTKRRGDGRIRAQWQRRTISAGSFGTLPTGFRCFKATAVDVDG